MNGPQGLTDDTSSNHGLHFDRDRLPRSRGKIFGHHRKTPLLHPVDRVQRQLDGGAGPNFNQANLSQSATFNSVGFAARIVP